MYSIKLQHNLQHNIQQFFYLFCRVAEMQESKNKIIRHLQSWIEIFEIFSVVEFQLLIQEFLLETDYNFLICYLESVKYKRDVLNADQLLCLSLFRVGFTRRNLRFALFLSLCLQHESVLYCLEKVKHQFLNMVGTVMSNFTKFQLMKLKHN